MRTRNIFAAVMALWAVTACQHKSGQGSEEEMANADTMSTEIFVDTLRLHQQTFRRQLICNGKLKAVAKSELAFSNGGVVSGIYVHNGSRVAKGQLIAKTDASEAALDLEKTQKDLEKAQVDLVDKLIGLGYEGISDQVPAAVMHRAKLSSGYYQAQYQLQAARQALRKCSLVAPFSGRIADLDNKRNQQMDKVCTLIDDTQLDVEFSVLESEIKSLRKGQKVVVTPFEDDGNQYGGYIVNINPTVSEKGLIKVYARIPNDKGGLMDGMNVKIIVENDVPNSFVVPKDAVLDRDGYHVVFVYDDGEAVWTYVDIAYSNIGSYAITGCKRKDTEIHEGDVIITSGNLNLADGTEVKIKGRDKRGR